MFPSFSKQENELGQLKREYQNVCLEQGQGSQEAKNLESKIQSLSAELKQNKDALKKCTIIINNQLYSFRTYRGHDKHFWNIS